MQHHLIVNVDRVEYLDPKALGDGRRLLHLSRPCALVLSALAWLLARDNGRGAGDAPAHPLVGSWAGCRVTIAGDYGEAGVGLPMMAKEYWGEERPGEELPNLYRYAQVLGGDITPGAAAMLLLEPSLVRELSQGRRSLLDELRQKLVDPAPEVESTGAPVDPSVFDF